MLSCTGPRRSSHDGSTSTTAIAITAMSFTSLSSPPLSPPPPPSSALWSAPLVTARKPWPQLNRGTGLEHTQSTHVGCVPCSIEPCITYLLSAPHTAHSCRANSRTLILSLTVPDLCQLLSVSSLLPLLHLFTAGILWTKRHYSVTSSPPPPSFHRLHLYTPLSLHHRGPFTAFIRFDCVHPAQALRRLFTASTSLLLSLHRHNHLASVTIASHWYLLFCLSLHTTNSSPPPCLHHRRSLFTAAVSSPLSSPFTVTTSLLRMTITSYSHHFFYVAVFSPPSLRHTATTATPLHHSPLSPRITARPCHSRHLSSPPPSLHCHHSTTDRSLLKQRQRRSRRRCRSRSRPRHPRPHHHNRRQLRRHGSCRRFGRCQTAVTSSPPLSLHRHTRPSLLHCPPTLLFTAGPSRHFHHLSTTSLR